MGECKGQEPPKQQAHIDQRTPAQNFMQRFNRHVPLPRMNRHGAWYR